MSHRRAKPDRSEQHSRALERGRLLGHRYDRGGEPTWRARVQAAAPPPVAQLRRQRWRIATTNLWIKWSSRINSECTLAQSAARLHATTCPAATWEPPVDRDGCGTT